MHLECKIKREAALAEKKRNEACEKRLQELLDGAARLPVESQETLLLIAKGMLVTRRCLEVGDKKASQPSSSA